MRLYQSILFVVLATSLVACGRIDPESIADPVNEMAQRIVKISVDSGAETKANVNVVGNQGVVSFSEGEKLYLFETKKYDVGSSTTHRYESEPAIIKEGGTSADFIFVLSADTSLHINELTYIAAVGDWTLKGVNMEVNIPASFDMKDNGGSLLPQKGVIAMSNPYSGSVSEANKIFNSSVRLNHLVSYGILNITGSILSGKTITNIQITKASGGVIAGPATIKLKDSGTYTDISPGTGGVLDLTSLSINDDSATKISITPSEAVQKAIRDNTGTSIWFSSVYSTFSSPVKVTLTDSDSNTYYGQPDSSYATSIGGAAVINISSWSSE